MQSDKVKAFLNYLERVIFETEQAVDNVTAKQTAQAAVTAYKSGQRVLFGTCRLCGNPIWQGQEIYRGHSGAEHYSAADCDAGDAEINSVVDRILSA